MADSLVVRVSESILMKLSSMVTIHVPRFFLNWGRPWNWPQLRLTLMQPGEQGLVFAGQVWVGCRGSHPPVDEGSHVRL